MARFVVGAVFGIVVGTVLGAAAGLHAATAEDVQAPAAEAGVDPTELAGVVNTLQVDPRVYLRSEGLLERAPSPIDGKWLRLVQCEASGDWHNARNPVYKGGLQFDAPTWARYGGLAFAPRADFATPAQQVLVAERTLAAQGPRAWPLCGPRVGLR